MNYESSGPDSHAAVTQSLLSSQAFYVIQTCQIPTTVAINQAFCASTESVEHFCYLITRRFEISSIDRGQNEVMASLFNKVYLILKFGLLCR